LSMSVTPHWFEDSRWNEKRSSVVDAVIVRAPEAA
jgi:hypothetical protein